MKKAIFKAIFCATLLSSTAFVTSCSNNDDDNTETPIQELTPDNFKGTIKSGQSLTLDATKTYYLNRIITV